MTQDIPRFSPPREGRATPDSEPEKFGSDWLQWVEYNKEWGGAYDDITFLGSILQTYIGFNGEELQRYYEKWWHWGREWFTLQRIVKEHGSFDSEDNEIMDKHICMLFEAVRWRDTR